MSGRPPARSYLVCALPRSGARLLATSLRATKSIAAPEPRLWSGWRGHDPATRQLLRRDPASPGAAEVYERVRAAGTGPDGCFGAEVRWPELDRLLDALRVTPELDGTPEDATTDGLPEHELLARFLPGLRYVHLTREDKAAQAVAWWRARHARDCAGRPVPPAGPGLGAPSGDIDPVAVERLEKRLRDDEWRWVSFFTRAGVEPLVVSFESLTEDHAATVCRVLAYLDVPSAPAVPLRVPVARPARAPDPARADYVRWRRRRASGACYDADAPVSIVITGHRPEDDLAATVAAAREVVPDDTEIVVVEDRPAPAAPRDACADVPGAVVVRPPAPAGPAAVRNFGAGQARGDTLVFLDARSVPRPGWLEPLRAALAERSVAVAGPALVDPRGGSPTAFGRTWQDPLLRARWLEQHPGRPVPVPFVPSCCMAFRRHDFEAVGGFDIGMLASGSEDAEICLHLWRRGRLCLVVPASEVAHDRMAVAGAGEAMTPADAALYDALRLATMHFGPDTLLRTFEQATGWESFPAAYARLVNSDVFERRRRVVAGSTHDERWFLDRFGMEALR